MTTPTPPLYYNDFENALGLRGVTGRAPRRLDIYMSGPVGCGYIYTPTLNRDSAGGHGSTLSLMISAQTGIDITKTGSTGIMVAYKLGNDASQTNVIANFNSNPTVVLTTDNKQGITLSKGMSIAIGLSFGTGVTNNTAYTFYLVNTSEGGNSGELIWRMQYVVNSAVSTGWHQYGVHQSTWPQFNGNSDGLGPPLLYSYGASISGENGKTGYTGSSAGGEFSLSFPGSAQFKPFKINALP